MRARQNSRGGNALPRFKQTRAGKEGSKKKPGYRAGLSLRTVLFPRQKSSRESHSPGNW
jgi:hypothetical protein